MAHRAGRELLSWQQESLLTHLQQVMLEKKVNRPGSVIVSTTFDVPDHVTDTDLHTILHRITEREPSLRATSINMDGVEYAHTISAPVTHTECDDEQSARDFIARSKRIEFDTDGTLHWNIQILHYQGEDGNDHRTALAVFDHLITDRVSMALMVQELCTGREANPLKGAGKYRDWVSEQRAKFTDITQANSESQRFWYQHFGDTSPERAIPLAPFVTRPRDQHSEKGWIISEHVPVSSPRLTLACKCARATPLVLHLASVTSTLAEVSDTTDLTLRLQTAGRGPGSAEVSGFLTNTIPLRLQHAALGSFDGALAAARHSWRQILPRQDTPLGFLEKLFTGNSGTGRLAGRGQMVLNCFPDMVQGISESDYADQLTEAPQDFLELFIIPVATGGFMFRLICGAAELDIEDGRMFLRHLKEAFISNVEHAIDT
ncbi:condensation domain-containing protein [Streptomyces sp. NPDC093065]|uniref:condensation domain-containing protein n=1 Tax=Streptomyces sp. NPDC093065 TaxID=3366021 RepID=UPI0037F5A0CF